MDTRSQITIRTKKLGVLLRDARLASRKTVQECAEAIGVTKGVFKAYEEGRRSPSLPELEVLVYFLKLPINHFWGNEAISDDQPVTAPLDLPRLLLVRQRMIGALLATFIYQQFGFLPVTLIAVAFNILALLALGELTQKIVILPRILALLKRTESSEA